MITELKFDFNELVIDQSRIIRAFGYEGDVLPEPFSDYLEQAMHDCIQLPDICGAFQIVNREMAARSRTSVFTEGLEFKVGKTLCSELAGSERLAFFICTAGKTISEKSERLLRGNDPALGYVYDVLGSAIAEAVSERIQGMLRSEVKKNGDKITNRYSPGYCHWHVDEQHQLFSLFNGSACGVSLTSSALMYPVKSVSGVIGIGKEVVFRDYQCELCSMKTCVFREMHDF